MPESNPLQPGQTIGKGRFLLVKVLGRGGMGEVWLAQDQRLDEPAALKFLPAAIRGDAVALDDLRRETARSHRLTFPNIVRIHDFHHEDDGDVSFIAMEYVDGPTLAMVRLQQASRVMSWESLRPLVEQLCAGLDYAHGEGVIHRDLKPANMMVDGKGRLKLADFGIAAVVTDSMSRISLRHATSGTLVYMSPQQLMGKRPQPGDDIYALGATLYELLTSKPPFYTGDLPHRVINEPPEPLDERLAAMGIQNEIPADVSALIMACLAKDSAQRPQSVRAVAQWVGLETIHRPSVEALGEALSLEPAIPAGAPATILVEPPPEAADPASDPERKGTPWIVIGLCIAAVCAAALAGVIWKNRNAPGATHKLDVAAQSKQDAAQAAPILAVEASNQTEAPGPSLRDAAVTAPLASAQPQGSSPAVRLKNGVPNGGKPWTNSLGMRFAPVPGTRVLFSIWDTRVQDFQAFVNARSRSWLKPNFVQELTHPAVNVSWEDARMFCNWLTRKERAEGFLKLNEAYRLPTDREWSAADGLPEEKGSTPAERNRGFKEVFPWGRAWPPPPGAGNFADEALRTKRPNWAIIEGYNDGFANTSPVGNYTPNRYGLYDMAGNVWQWCEDWYDDAQKMRVLRGGAWQLSDRASLVSSHRLAFAPDSGNVNLGFRCVLAAVER